MDISGFIKVVFNITSTDALDLTTPVEAFAPTSEMSTTFTDGEGVNQAEQLWHERRTLGDDGTDDLELAHAGVATDLTDAFGEEVIFKAIKAIFIHVRLVAGVPGDAGLIVGNAAADEWLGFLIGAGDTILVPPGGTLLAIAPAAAGWAVAAGARLKLLHNGGGTDDLDYDIALLGTV